MDYLWTVNGKAVFGLSHKECAKLIRYSAGILEQSMGARNRVGIRLSYRPARLHRLPESVP
jgi:hypothetical protein